MIMSIDERKIGTACFIGAAVCVGTLLLVYLSDSHPWFYGTGVIAGFLAGYLAFEFEEVMAAIPIAVRAAVTECGIAKSTCWEFAKWFVQPHPFLHQAIVFGLLSFSLVLWKSWFLSPSPSLGEKFFMLPVFAFFYPYMFAYAVAYWLALLGAQRCARCYWDTVFLGQSLTESEERELSEKYTKMPLTYQNLLRWEAKGIGFIIWHLFFFLHYDFWKWVGMSVVYAVKVVVLFFWHLFKLIHSKKRLSCGVYSTVGGTVTFVLGWHIPSSPVEYGILIFTGGCIGAVLGVVVGWKLISVKCFDMPEHSPV